MSEIVEPIAEEADHRHKASFLGLTLGSVGVVYGDIGTSPLYALREALHYVDGGDGVERAEVIGVVSLLIWALVLIVTLKYVLFLLRLDNRGEGGALSLLALVQTHLGRRTTLLFILGVFGAALFYGDAIITPAISVLSAVEGFVLVTPTVEPDILPITLAILVTLFAVQHRGTGAVALFFGPITAVWFAVMGLAGAYQIMNEPAILHALNPGTGLVFLSGHGMFGIFVLGAVFLAVTGAEALYADLGHFGRRPIQLAWMGLVLPSLVLNYLGQGALVLADPAAIANPFFLLVPDWALVPLVMLATAATVIASQAVITGAYSLTRQAIQMGLLPRLEITHTSETQTGQIYLPAVNLLLLLGVVTLVLLFQTSSQLAAAYGIAVTGTMIVSSMLAFLYIRLAWRWPLWLAVAVVAPILMIELAFLSANLLKLLDGGYVPLLLAMVIVGVMWTWVRGSAILAAKTRKGVVPIVDFVANIEKHAPHLVPGTAIFLTSDPDSTPAALLHNIKHNRVLHEQNVILTVRTRESPTVADADRVSIETIGERFRKVEMRFGFMETPNVSQALGRCRKQGLRFDIMLTSFFLGRRTLRPDPKSGMPAWQDALFITLARAATDPTDFYRLPPNRVVELGSQVTV